MSQLDASVRALESREAMLKAENAQLLAIVEEQKLAIESLADKAERLQVPNGSLFLFLSLRDSFATGTRSRAGEAPLGCRAPCQTGSRFGSSFSFGVNCHDFSFKYIIKSSICLSFVLMFAAAEEVEILREKCASLSEEEVLDLQMQLRSVSEQLEANTSHPRTPHAMHNTLCF